MAASCLQRDVRGSGVAAGLLSAFPVRQCDGDFACARFTGQRHGVEHGLRGIGTVELHLTRIVVARLSAYYARGGIEVACGGQRHADGGIGRGKGTCCGHLRTFGNAQFHADLRHAVLQLPSPVYGGTGIGSKEAVV